MKLIMLSSKDYSEPDRNYGDCFVIISQGEAIIYDCGSEEHAKRVVEILDSDKIDKATVVLSHNDDDHFMGIPYLIERGRVDKLFTILLLKYKKELLDIIDDGRVNRDSLSRKISEIYDNIYSLGGKVPLCDVYEDVLELPDILEFIGPEREYMLKAAAKGLDSREGDIIDTETFTNAASIQIKVKLGQKSVLLTGDCAPKAIPKDVNLREYSCIQLPHHGKASLAQEIFDRVYPENVICYLVSDNTGSSNGGSDDLDRSGHKIEETKNGDITISENDPTVHYHGRLGR